MASLSAPSGGIFKYFTCLARMAESTPIGVAESRMLLLGPLNKMTVQNLFDYLCLWDKFNWLGKSAVNASFSFSVKNINEFFLLFFLL